MNNYYPKTTGEITIADLGCGGGDMLRMIDSWGKNKNLKLNLIGIDANPNIVAFAKRNLIAYPHIQFKTLNIFSEEFQKQQYDIVIGTLFYHHFSSDQLVHFFKKLKQQVAIGFIINDIHRHWLAYYSIKLLTQAFSKSPMVKYDAPLSVLRAFKRRELRKMLDATAIENFTITMEMGVPLAGYCENRPVKPFLFSGTIFRTLAANHQFQL